MIQQPSRKRGPSRLRIRDGFRLAHAWLGLIAALGLLILSVSGTLLIFKDDYIRWTTPGADTPAPARSPDELAQALARAQTEFGNNLRSMELASEDIGLDQVRLQDGGGAYVHPTTGQVVQRWAKNERLADWLFDLHHYFLAGKTGGTWVGIFGLVGAALSLVGVYLWLPYARQFRWKAWPERTSRPALVKSHRDMGMIFVVPIVFLALTGSAMIFSKTVKPMMIALFGGETEAEAPDIKAGAGEVRWADAIARVQALYPNAQIRRISFAAEPGDTAVIRIRQPEEMNPNGRTMIKFDPATSEIVSVDDSLKAPVGSRIYDTFYPLHAAKALGPLYLMLTTATGIAFTLLSAFGAWAYLKKLTKRRAPAAAAATRVATAKV